MGYFLIKYEGGETPYTGNYSGIKSYCERKGIKSKSIIEFPNKEELVKFIKANK
ncbi:hypothetical protein [Christiangramia fulva]|uniref:hypothetical protein n=1 Tax=Christiangramia fulva TaxID=2126553 RepID=UPI00131B588D|nr:hypothetical protein [Christiangramia fulva]